MEYSKNNISDLNPFFYGVTLVHHPKRLTYQSDAISANYQLNISHYQKHHIYRVEWEPPAEDGTGGYVKWFTNGQQIFGIKASILDIMQTEIPSEPMYLIMNTAVSSSWGFPMPCPDNCLCDCFECGNPACSCAQPSGYCENFPAAFEIDYVRVYQAVDDERHVLGCSPKHRPTDLFIKGHPKRYMSDGQKRPLEPVQHGGAACTKHSECGGKRANMGVCSSAGLCVCMANYTGPRCLAHDGYFDFDTSRERKPFSCTLMLLMTFMLKLDHLQTAHMLLFLVSEMVIPKSMAITAMFLTVGFLLSMFVAIRNNSRKAKYQQIGHATMVNRNGIPPITSYQDASAAVQYALPSNLKSDVTYCVIDGRLVDDR